MVWRKFFSGIGARLGSGRGGPPSAASGATLSADDRQFVADMLAGLAAQVVHEQDLIAARGKVPVSVRLVPQVPFRDPHSATAWLGGGARLPSGMAWPEIDGSPLQLLAQIDCARLPADLWGGVGPREGWLAIFLDPISLCPKVLHFAETGVWHPSPPVQESCNMTGYDGRKRAAACGYAWRFTQSPVDVVSVTSGADDPCEQVRGASRVSRFDRRHDFVDDGLWPFDWPTTRLLFDCALSSFGAAMSREARHLTPPALAAMAEAIRAAEASGADAEAVLGKRLEHDEFAAMAAVRAFAISNGVAVVDRILALKERVERLAVDGSFSPALIAPILAELKALQWKHKVAPPFYRDGHRLTQAERSAEGVRILDLPFTTHDPNASPSWVYAYETELLEAAKAVYAENRSVLSAELIRECEAEWSDEAAREIAGMGHVPWRYVHEFDMAAEVTLLELPSSKLIGWMFGDVDHLVVTVDKKSLARNDFSKVRVQVTN